MDNPGVAQTPSQQKEQPHAQFTLSEPLKMVIFFALVSFLVTIGIMSYTLGTQREQAVNQKPIVPSPTIIPPTPTPDPTTTWKTYRNEAFGFDVKYPGDWELVGSGTTRVFLSPSGPRGEALFMQFDKKTISLEDFIFEYNKQGSDFQIADQKTIEFAGTMATKLSGSSITGVANQFIFIPLGQQSLIIRYQDIDETQLQILSTFQFLN